MKKIFIIDKCLLAFKPQHPPGQKTKNFDFCMETSQKGKQLFEKNRQVGKNKQSSQSLLFYNSTCQMFCLMQIFFKTLSNSQAQRENTLRDSLQKFITLHKARSVCTYIFEVGAECL